MYSFSEDFPFSGLAAIAGSGVLEAGCSRDVVPRFITGVLDFRGAKPGVASTVGLSLAIAGCTSDFLAVVAVFSKGFWITLKSMSKGSLVASPSPVRIVLDITSVVLDGGTNGFTRGGRERDSFVRSTAVTVAFEAPITVSPKTLSV